MKVYEEDEDALNEAGLEGGQGRSRRSVARHAFELAKFLLWATVACIVAVFCRAVFKQE